MNPHQRNKVDISKLSPDEQRLFRLYGKLPNKTDLLQNKLKERKYFDSGDYAMSKAGKTPDNGVTSIGREHPNPESIPHLSTSPHEGSGSGSNGSGSAGQRTSIHGPSGSIGDRLVLPPGTQVKSAAGGGGSPIKETSSVSRSGSVDDLGKEAEEDKIAKEISPPPAREGMPIRQ